MMDLHYRILNSGISLPSSAGSANGVKATPVYYDRVDGRYGPGDRIEIRRGEERRLRARARSRGELEVLQLILNGEVVDERRGQGARELVLEGVHRFDRSSWVSTPSGSRASGRKLT